MISLVAELVPRFIGVCFATRLHDGLVQLFKWIVLRDQHQAVRPATRIEKQCRYGFGHACKGLYRIGYLVRCYQEVGDPLPRFRIARVSQIGVAPFRQFISAAIVKLPFKGCQERGRKAIFATSFRGVDACQLVELLMCHARCVVRPRA